MGVLIGYGDAEQYQRVEQHQESFREKQESTGLHYSRLVQQRAQLLDQENCLAQQTPVLIRGTSEKEMFSHLCPALLRPTQFWLQLEFPSST